MRNWSILVGVVVAAALAALVGTKRPEEPTDSSPTLEAPKPAEAPVARAVARGPEQFVGSASCSTCHRAQAEAYSGSHHQRALVAPEPALKPRFDGAKLTSRSGGTTAFSWRDGAPFVSTSAGGSKGDELPIRYVSGVWPLEQYVVATERGKLQSLGVVWDTRSVAEGGARWLHVYGKDGIGPHDPLFFTGSAQNWNHVCADCHSTRVERRYDVGSDSFDTRWAELSVGCEACHGPGAEHVQSARQGKAKPFAARLTRSEPWQPSASGSPTPRRPDGVEVEVCAPCHSRRTPIQEGFVASDALLDSFLPELLRPGSYHADGQVEGEVYEWASFLQSRMYRAGVKCSDCHEPHSGKPFADGNALCVRCHEGTRFDTSAHSRHDGPRAPRCIDCHMPPSTFMQIDERRDHSIRIPRPDLSVALGTPNACNGCHEEQPAAWARDALARWFPASPARPHFGSALAADRKGSLDAARELRRLAGDGSAPAIARATALERLGAHRSDKTKEALRAALASSEPLVVYGAVLGAAALPPADRPGLLLSAVEHRRRGVRVAAAKALGGVALAPLPPRTRVALERAFAEVEQSFAVNASRADSHVERSAFELARGKLSDAEAALRTALRLAPCLPEAFINLADLERQRGNEAAAGRALNEALACNPESAAVHHALGLWQVRARQPQLALVSLKRAVQLDPNDARFRYVLAAALASDGERPEAIRVLETTLEHRPNDVPALQALAGYLRDSGDPVRASELHRKVEALLRE